MRFRKNLGPIFEEAIYRERKTKQGKSRKKTLEELPCPKVDLPLNSCSLVIHCGILTSDRKEELI